MPGYVFQFRLVFQELPSLLEGAVTTLHLSLPTLLLSLVVGTAGALCRLSGVRWLRRPAIWYVEIVRNTPLLVQLFFIYFGLGQLSIDVPNYLTNNGEPGNRFFYGMTDGKRGSLQTNAPGGNPRRVMWREILQD